MEKWEAPVIAELDVEETAGANKMSFSENEYCKCGTLS